VADQLTVWDQWERRLDVDEVVGGELLAMLIIAGLVFTNVQILAIETFESDAFQIFVFVRVAISAVDVLMIHLSRVISHFGLAFLQLVIQEVHDRT